MGAIGAYIKHMQYDSIVFLDSKNDSRLGIVINGHLVEGKSSIAGQTCFLPVINHEDYKNRRSMKGRSQLLVIKMNDMPHLIYIDDFIDEAMLGMESISKDSLFDNLSR